MVLVPEKLMIYLINIKKTSRISLKAYMSVLVTAKIDLVFFTVAAVGLHFGFVVETVLITCPT